MPTRYDVDRDALTKLLAGEPRYRVDPVWDGLYRQLAAPADLTALPRALRHRLDDDLPAALSCGQLAARVELGPTSVDAVTARTR